MNKLFLLVLFALPWCCNSQITTLKFKEKQILKIASETSPDVLNVVIENEKHPDDAALVAAVKKYWKQGKYKFMPELEFKLMVKDSKFKKGDMYLFKSSDVAYANAGYYFSGRFSLSSDLTKKKDVEYIGYTLPNDGYDSKGKVVEGYYNLMIKYFDHELSLIKDAATRKTIKAKNPEREITFFDESTEEVKGKDILYTKELVYDDGKTIKSKSEGNEEVQERLVKKYKADKSRIYTVFPEDINMAVTKGDDKVLIYDGRNLIDPKSGSVKATSYKKPAGRGLYYIYSAVSLIVSIVLIVMVLNK